MPAIEEKLSQHIAGLHRQLAAIRATVDRLDLVEIGSMEQQSEDIVDDAKSLASDALEFFGTAKAFRSLVTVVDR